MLILTVLLDVIVVARVPIQASQQWGFPSNTLFFLFLFFFSLRCGISFSVDSDLVYTTNKFNISIFVLSYCCAQLILNIHDMLRFSIFFLFLTWRVFQVILFLTVYGIDIKWCSKNRWNQEVKHSLNGLLMNPSFLMFICLTLPLSSK